MESVPQSKKIWATSLSSDNQYYDIILRYRESFCTVHDLSGYAMRGFPIIKAKLERGSLVFLSHKYKITAGQDSNMEFRQHKDCNYCNNLAKTDSAPVINTVLSNQWEVHR